MLLRCLHHGGHHIAALPHISSQRLGEGFDLVCRKTKFASDFIEIEVFKQLVEHGPTLSLWLISDEYSRVGTQQHEKGRGSLSRRALFLSVSERLFCRERYTWCRLAHRRIDMIRKLGEVVDELLYQLGSSVVIGILVSPCRARIEDLAVHARH
mgnify:CR=1 FL=1